LILEGDYSQLEFRVAGFLSKDKQVYDDVDNNVDVHSYTAEVMGISRQDAKAHTFKPLYGGTQGTEKQREYYGKFKTKYSGVAEWHKQLQEEAIAYKRIRLPSGRVYKFPYVERTRYGTASHATSIKNYPVQGFATADLLPIALVRTHKAMKTLELKSLIINTVHDSIIIDVHPDEKKACIIALQQGMYSLVQECKKRYNIEYDMPIGTELKIGEDWLNLKEIV
jgi:DNA polymerase I-like protein with 3'-5' exonuclease and polymerase domains